LHKHIEMSTKLNLAVYHNLPPGGAKRALFEMVRRLARKHRVDLFTLSCAANEFCDIRPYVENVFTYPFDAWPSSLFQSPFGRLNAGIELSNLLRLRRLSREISRQIDQGSYDVVFVHHCRYTQSPSVLEFLNTPSVYYCHESVRWMYEPAIPRPYQRCTRLGRYVNGLDFLRKAYSTTLKLLDRVNTKRADLVLVNSYFSRESIYRIYGVSARVCYLGVDTEHFRPLEVPKENMVLSAGSITPMKGNELIIEGLAHVPEKMRPSAVLASHAGNAEERHFLENLAADRGVDLVFRDLNDNGLLVKLYNAAIMTAYTPYLEPLGLVPLESMACGTPVVGVREGGVRETIMDGQTGILINRIPEEFGQAVQTLLEDRRLANQYGEQGREYVRKQWSWEKAVQELEARLVQAADHNNELQQPRKVGGE